MVKYGEKKYLIFSCSLLMLSLIFWTSVFLTRGDSLFYFFVPSAQDTAMDYFNMLGNIPGGNPYVYNANYPAMCFLLWTLLYHIIPYHPEGTSGLFLRSYMPAQMGYIICFIICLIVLWEMLKKNVKEKYYMKVIFASSIIFSGPILFTLERGNIIILSLLFTFLFTQLYDSERKIYRYLSYVFLALAASIKIYPALFGLLLLNKKRKRETVILIFFGILFFILPFFFFDGMDSLKTMMNGIFLSSEDAIKIGFGYNFSFSNIVRMCYGWIGVFKEQVSSMFLIIPIVSSIFIVLTSELKWKKMFAIVLLILWIPTFSYTYTLIFFLIPLVFFLNEEKKKGDMFYLFGFVLILAPYALPKLGSINYLLGKEFKFYLTGGMVLVNGIILVMTLGLFWEGILRIFARLKIEKRKESVRFE